jgi:hypothetical protein
VQNIFLNRTCYEFHWPLHIASHLYIRAISAVQLSLHLLLRVAHSVALDLARLLTPHQCPIYFVARTKSKLLPPPCTISSQPSLLLIIQPQILNLNLNLSPPSKVQLKSCLVLLPPNSRSLTSPLLPLAAKRSNSLKMRCQVCSINRP